MVAAVKPSDLDVKIKFGGGLHTRASADEIDAREAAAGSNFLLDIQNKELRNREPFDLIGQLPNQLEVRGGGSLLKSDGTVSTLFQGAGVVYEWDGQTGFNAVGTCNASSKLRGRWDSHNWTLTDKVLFSDIALADTVKEWDGSTFQSVTFTNSSASGAAFGAFYSKYISVTNERVLFGNVKDGSGALPHLMVGSAGSDYTQISVADRPSTALSESDPFYLVTPDLKPVNGIVQAFGASIISTEKGRLYNLTGSTSKDFSLDEFFAGSAASGSESLAYIGNDIVYGRQGRIDSARDTSSFGNSQSYDITLEVGDKVAGYESWTTAFNSRTNRAYFFPGGQSEVWVLNTSMRTSRFLTANALDQFVFQNQIVKQSGQLSPWMKYTTNHSLAFMPTFVLPMLDPLDGLEYVFMGDSSGHVYRLEGTGSSGDGGSSNVDVSWTSKLFSAPLDAQAYVIEGYVKYRKNAAATITLTLLAAGVTAFDKAITIDIPALSGNYFGGSVYFGGPVYFGVAFMDRLIRQRFDLPGQANEFQIKLDISGTTNFAINEIGLRFKAASQ